MDTNELLNAFSKGIYKIHNRTIEDTENCIEARYEESDVDSTYNWKYYITGVYNSGFDSVEIDLNALDNLMQICNRLSTMGKGGEDECQ